MPNYVPQHLATMVCHFMGEWKIVEADCGISGREQIDLLQRWHPITVPRSNSVSSSEPPILSWFYTPVATKLATKQKQNSTQVQRLSSVTQYLCPYSASVIGQHQSAMLSELSVLNHFCREVL